jgi:hypothetical protein
MAKCGTRMHDRPGGGAGADASPSPSGVEAAEAMPVTTLPALSLRKADVTGSKSDASAFSLFHRLILPDASASRDSPNQCRMLSSYHGVSKLKELALRPPKRAT